MTPLWLMVLLSSLVVRPDSVKSWGVSTVPSESECRPYIEKALKEHSPKEAVDTTGSEQVTLSTSSPDQERSIEESEESKSNTEVLNADGSFEKVSIENEDIEGIINDTKLDDTFVEENVERDDDLLVDQPSMEDGSESAESGDTVTQSDQPSNEDDSAESPDEVTTVEISTEEFPDTQGVASANMVSAGEEITSSEDQGGEESAEDNDIIEEKTLTESLETTQTTESISNESLKEGENVNLINEDIKGESEGSESSVETNYDNKEEYEGAESSVETNDDNKDESGEAESSVDTNEDNKEEFEGAESSVEINEDNKEEFEGAESSIETNDDNKDESGEAESSVETNDNKEEFKGAESSVETNEDNKEEFEGEESSIETNEDNKEKFDGVLSEDVEVSGKIEAVNVSGESEDTNTLREELAKTTTTTNEETKESKEDTSEMSSQTVDESLETNDAIDVTSDEIYNTEDPVNNEETQTSTEGIESAEESIEQPEQTVEDQLTLEFEAPAVRRPRDHITEILHLSPESAETELLLAKTIDSTLKELKRLYDVAIKPLEILFKYRDLSNRHFGDPEIFSKPLILFMGPWSGGKSTILNYLLDNEFKPSSIRTGAEPSPAYFNILMWGEREEVLDGTQLAADWTFSGLQKFGQGLLDRLRGLKLKSALLEKVNIVEIPGILEIRKQVERLFPFNDACQWFIDRADIIFLVYDPSKLDVGPETEAILDQLKGREYQTRIILNKADQVKPEELMRVQGTLIWNISPLMSSTEPPVMYSTSLWSLPYEQGAPSRLLHAQERAFLRDMRQAVDKRVENKIASARRFAVRVRNHAKMVDCYLTTYYNHKSFFGNKKKVADDIIEHPQNYHIYEGLSTLTNISRYDLPDPEVYRDFFRLNPLYDFQRLSETCTYFRGCPINRLDVAIAYDLPELVGKYKKQVENVLEKQTTKS